MKAFPKSASQFKRQAEAGFRRENRDAKDAARVTFPTGLKGFSGVLEVTATGYRPRTFVASATPETGLSVR